nr:uncharacterized protein LOC111424408 [Onthophagus taurus]
MGNVESFQIRHACGPKGCSIRYTALFWTGLFMLIQAIIVLISIIPLTPAHAQYVELERRCYRVFFLFMLIHLNLYIAAFVGIYLRFKELLLPWLLIQGSFIVLLFLTASVLFIIIEYFIFVVLLGLIYLYHWVLVHSYYHKLALDFVPSYLDADYSGFL